MSSVLATLTPVAMLAEATTVVTDFGDLLVFVVGLGLGLFVVGFIISKAKAAKRG